jgi:DNA-binding response OmpR family regulator
MASATIIYIRHPHSKDNGKLDALTERYHVVSVPSGKRALHTAQNDTPDLFVLDADSLRTSGERICRKLKRQFVNVPVIHIAPPDLADSPADVFLKETGPRHLLNSIERILHVRDEEVIECGPFSMNVPRRLLTVNGHERELPPKQARLMTLFLRHPGETLDRKTIMAKVWDTEYTGDTRTLDVHVRWIRRLIEKNNGNKKPRYLKTVRGVGYRLEPNGKT